MEQNLIYQNQTINLENYRNLYYRMFPRIFRELDNLLSEENIMDTSFNEQNKRIKPMSKEARDELKEYEVTSKDLENKLSCAICQEGFKEGEKVIRLPCLGDGHFFHNKVGDECLGINPWLEENNTCPVCRYEFPSEPEPEPESEPGQIDMIDEEESSAEQVSDDTIDNAIDDILNNIIMQGTTSNMNSNNMWSYNVGGVHNNIMETPTPVRIMVSSFGIDNNGEYDDNDEELQSAIFESMNTENSD
jgi:hypothetical protein